MKFAPLRTMTRGVVAKELKLYIVMNAPSSTVTGPVNVRTLPSTKPRQVVPFPRMTMLRGAPVTGLSTRFVTRMPSSP